MWQSCPCGNLVGLTFGFRFRFRSVVPWSLLLPSLGSLFGSHCYLQRKVKRKLRLRAQVICIPSHTTCLRPRFCPAAVPFCFCRCKQIICGFSVGCNSRGVKQQTHTPVPSGSSLRETWCRQTSGPGSHQPVDHSEKCSPSFHTVQLLFCRTHEFIRIIPPEDHLIFQALCMNISSCGNKSS